MTRMLNTNEWTSNNVFRNIEAKKRRKEELDRLKELIALHLWKDGYTTLDNGDMVPADLKIPVELLDTLMLDAKSLGDWAATYGWTLCLSLDDNTNNAIYFRIRK